MTACRDSEPPPAEDTAQTEAVEVIGEIPPLPVQVMTRESNEWQGFFNSPTFEITGDGTYSGTVTVTGGHTIIPMIIISAVGTTTVDGILPEAEKAPATYTNATVKIDSVLVNGNPLVLTDNEDILLIPDDGPLVGYANVQIWNAWYEPNQRVNVEESDGVTALDMSGGEHLQFSSPVNSIEIEFTVDGVVAWAVPVDVTPDVTDAPEEIPYIPPTNVDITGDFNAALTAEQLVREIGVGWNLGNTLDAYHSDNPSEPIHWVNHNNMQEVETAWIGGVENATTQALIKRVKESGFNAIRIPVTWYKMAEDYPDFTISENWMSHVQSIVNMAVAEDMYIILNTHHDEYIMRFDQDPAVGERAVTALWTQIAERFRDYDEKLIFEGLNEPRARTNGWDTQGHWNWNGSTEMYNTINRWNQAFVNAVRATGGNNQLRHLMLATYAAQSTDGPMSGFSLPNDPVSGNGTNKFILSIHVYSPHHWAHNGDGSYEGDSAVRRDIERVANRAAELGIPVIFGEWGSVTRNNLDQRVQHAHDYIRIATEMRNRANNPVVMACFWWDDSGSFALIHRTRPISDNSLRIINAITRAREGLALE
jgi:endoglucanase